MVFFGFNPGFPRWNELKAGKIPVSGGAAMARWSAAGLLDPGLCDLGLGLDHGDWLCSGATPACFSAAGSRAAFQDGCGVPLGLVHDCKAFLPQLHALAMVDGVAAIGDGLELRSSVSWPNPARSLHDLTLCRSHREGFSGAKPLPAGSLVIIWGIGDLFISDFGIGVGSCKGFIHWRSQVKFRWLIVPCEIFDLLVISYLKLDLQLDRDKINVQLIMEVGCVMAATCDVEVVCVGWVACCHSFYKWLHLISSGSGNVNCFFLLEFKWNSCSCITSTSSGLHHLFDLVGYMRNYLCCLVTIVVDTTLGQEICNSYYGVCEASLLNNHKASLVIGEVNLSGSCLRCIWIKNGFEDVLEESVKAFSFGSFHQWRVRSLLLLVPRFNGRHDLRPSSVKRTKNLQLGTVQPQVQKPIRSLGEPPGYYRRAHWLRPSRTAVVVARRSSRPIRHQAPLVVFTHSLLELLFELCLCMLQSHVLATPFVGVPHPVNVL